MASQIFTVLTLPLLMIRFPSELKPALVTAPECPFSVSVSWPVLAFQTFTTPPEPPLTIRFPSGLKLTL